MIILCGNVLLLRYMSLDMLFRVAVCVQAHPPRDKDKMHRLTADYPTSSPNPTGWKTKSASNYLASGMK